jgi:hypothetical protein
MAGFAQALAGFADKVEAQMDATARGAALEVMTRVVLRTPVETGRARGNWILTLDSPAEVATESTDKPGGPTIAAAAAVLPENGTAGRTIWVTNSLPYIRRLEQGHSQKGSHMVARTVDEWGDIVAKAAAAARLAYP